MDTVAVGYHFVQVDAILTPTEVGFRWGVGLAVTGVHTGSPYPNCIQTQAYHWDGVMATGRKVTWDKAGQRWKRIYKGRPFYGERGVRKTDDNAYRAGVEEFERWRARIDLETDAAKPYRAEYGQAIKLRQAMMDWLRIEGLETRTPEERTAQALP